MVPKRALRRLCWPCSPKESKFLWPFCGVVHSKLSLPLLLGHSIPCVEGRSKVFLRKINSRLLHTLALRSIGLQMFVDHLLRGTTSQKNCNAGKL